MRKILVITLKKRAKNPKIKKLQKMFKGQKETILLNKVFQ
jgi:hypothetical protein